TPCLNQRTAGCFDGSARTCCSGHALQSHLASDFAGLDYFGVTSTVADDAGLLEYLHIDLIDGQTLKVGQTNFDMKVLIARREATLGQTTMQRHLTAFESDFVKAAGTRLLALVTTTSGLTETGANATTDAAAFALATRSRLQCVQLSFRHPDSFQASETV